MAELTEVARLARPALTELYWLGEAQDWAGQLRAADATAAPAEAWQRLAALANTRLDFVRTVRLDRSLQRRFGAVPPDGIGSKPIRLAVIGSSTLTQHIPAIRVGALRRGIWASTYEPEYGQYLQELMDPGSGLHAFQPNTVLIALDAYHLMRAADPAADQAAADAILESILAHLRECWALARKAFRCPIVQQTALPLFPAILGSNEHRLPGSPHRLIARLNDRLRDLAEAETIDLLAIDAHASAYGLPAWHDPVLWHRAKQEIGPVASPLYGDLLGRLLAARQGRSAKCLVLDLDNTLWGGVIGDDGLHGITIGQGSEAGEAFLALQNYARDQARRGILLAVCSKNDEVNALLPFESHPDMALKRGDIACFVANWNDKPRNLRAIAQQLNIGLDSLVFVDDNPFERELVRAELPMVAVPELPDDPARVVRCIADAGYFEGVAVTEEDRQRTQLYQADAGRASLAAEATDLGAYLRGLDMRLVWKRFDRVGLPRIVQLINKTNQFNLTTRRYSEDEALAVMDDQGACGLQLRLLDRFGDNGIIAIVIVRLEADGDAAIDTWLMSCRVLGRQVEAATLAVVAEQAKRLGARRLIGAYRRTAKNAMVKEHFGRLGFAPLGPSTEEASNWVLDLDLFTPAEFCLSIVEG